MRNEHSTYVNAAFGATGVMSNDWLHRAGSARAYYLSNAPTLRPDGVTSLGTNDAGRIWVSNGTGQVAVWNGSAFVSTGVSGLIEAKNGVLLIPKVLTVGSWNMDATASLGVAHGLTATKIKGCTAIVFADGLTSMATFVGSAGQIRIRATSVSLIRTASKLFDSAVYNSTGFNRGFVQLWYTL